ncbi:MAG: hypothetical protein IT378_06600 [Sandaracinaceae bacterium]|nr:hypothetical protein [Sandaracinaceae bacterium]
MRTLSFLLLLSACGSQTVGRVDAGSDAGSSLPDSGPTDDAGADAGPGTVTIFQIQDPSRPGAVPAGASVRISGAVVTAIDAFEERGSGMGYVGDVWIADPAGGPFSGVHVYMPAHVPCGGASTLGLGDVVDVEGTVQEFAVPSDTSGRTVTQLVSGRVTCTTAGDGVGPAARAIADLATLSTDATAEEWEGVLIELSGVEASADPDFGAFPLAGGLPVDDDLYRHPATLRDRFTRLRGVFHYQFGRYALYPRQASDVELGTPRVLEWEDGLFGCADGADRDSDGDLDCDDPDCAETAFCTGTTVRVQDVQDVASAMHPALDAQVALRGPLVVTAVDTFMEMPGAAYAGTVVVQDPSATDPRHSGVHVFLPSTVEPCGSALALGDRVYVAGRYREYADASDTGGTLTEITSGTVSCASSGAPLAPAAIASPSDLAAAATAEPWEGVLVELSNVTVTMAPGMFGRFVVTGGVAVDDDLYRVPGVAQNDTFTRLAGILTYAFEYQLEPRSAADVAP